MRPAALRQIIFTLQAERPLRPFCGANAAVLWVSPATATAAMWRPASCVKRSAFPVPWIALALLGYIGGKMLVDGIKGEEAEEAAELSAGALLMQGVATSIDALSVGFTISEYGWLMALAASLIIAVVTFFICMAGLRIGKKFGTKLSGKASILGGIILIGIGLEIFISGVF